MSINESVKQVPNNDPDQQPIKETKEVSEKTFLLAYEGWKRQANTMKNKLQELCSELLLSQLMDGIETQYKDVSEAYERMRKIVTPSTDLRRKADSCKAVTSDLVALVNTRLTEFGEVQFDAEQERQRLRGLKTAYATSVFGSVSQYSKLSGSQSLKAKAAEAAADLAAKKARLKNLEELEKERARLSELETEQRKRSLEMAEAVEVQRRRLEKLDAKGEVEIAEAKYRVLNEESLGEGSSLASQVENVCQVDADSSQHVSIPNLQGQCSLQNDSNNLAQVLADSISLSRLPAPEPPVFTGDPLNFIEWSISFKTLIETRCRSAADKLFYLQRYVGGEAKTVLEGTFYRKDEEAYSQAWDRLTSRYGHPFAVQRAFRDKLNKWPKIAAKDSVKLREFSDFLQACSNAIPHVKGLDVLNDCEENQKLLIKLPDYVISRWNRYVTTELYDKNDYPSFEMFSSFIAKEARIACNPVSSFHALKNPESNDKTAREPRRSKANAFVIATTSSPKDNKATSATSKSVVQPFKPQTCTFCEVDGHSIHKCFKFSEQSMEDKRKYIQENRLCFGCLRKGHHSINCRNKSTCAKCKRCHPTPLHENRGVTCDANSRTKHNTGKTEEASAVSCKVQLGGSHSTSMIVPIWVSSKEAPSHEVLVYALLDTQSDSTFILEEIARSVPIKCQPTSIKLSTMTSTASIIQCNAVSDLCVRGLYSTTKIKIPRTYTKDFIPVDRSHIPTSETAKKWPHLQRISRELAPLQSCEIGMLIGYNCPQALAPRETIIGRDDEPYAIKTDLGWSIVGYSNRSCCCNAIEICHRATVREIPCVSPREIIRSLEADFNETHHGEKTVSQEDLQFLKILDSNMHQTKRGHYSMPLPFKSGKPMLPNNKGTALVRLSHLRRKFVSNPAYYEDYSQFMNDVIEKGDAEEVDKKGDEGKMWYIPHHGVYHPKKPEKIRVVFDCSARFGGTSLNSHLLTGPDLINCLIGILFRFRKHEVAIACDIERMYHQFEVEEDDRDYLRFLWWKRGDVTIPPSEYRMKVHLFGAASSPGCANYGLKYIARVHGKDKPKTSQFIQSNFYVDDGLSSVESSTEAITLVQNAQEICRHGGLRLHKFISNSREVMESIPASERSTQMTDIDLSYDDLPIERTLGLQWCVESDTFKFRIQIKDQPLTRRGILCTVASIYDPLGLLAPFVLTGKRILQEMCRKGIAWDELLPDELRPRWERWRADFINLEQINIARCYKPPDYGNVISTELHHFSDASYTSYGQCSYLRQVSKDQVHCSLVVGKARVAPTKVVTIPRLELTAAVVSVKMSNLLKEELEYSIDREYFWTDSQVVLGYISNEARRFHVFVANRVEKIRQSSEPKQWHHVHTENNPADHASRGLFATELLSSNWFKGPDFLWERELSISVEPTPELKVGDPEIKSLKTFTNSVLGESFNVTDRMVRFSTWSKAIGAIARLRRRAKKMKSPIALSTPQEREEAETFIIKSIQGQAFAEEMKALSGSTRVKSTSSVYNLNPFIDQRGVLRVGGRLGKAKVPDDVKHPAILPKDSHVTKLLIAHYHNRIQHQGRGMTLNEIRSNGYWIIGGNKAVADLLYKCIQCRRMRRPVQEQKMASLPEDRVQPSPPFTFCGMDCFGPFYIKHGRKEYKRYGLLFTCLSSRAVHIEMLDDMSTDAFINALRCFIALRGAVRHIRSDQGSNFIGARKEFREALKEVNVDRLQAYLQDKQCEFIMNPPYASHFGGVWERQIRSVRNILTFLLKQCQGRLDDSSLRTFFYEAMAIVNSRPLSIENINDPSSEPLTPNHLLTMKSVNSLPPPGKFVKEDLYIKKRWRRVQFLAEQFWCRWKKEYLNNLTQRQKWNQTRRNLQVGDIVLIKDDDVPRLEWSLAKVVETTKADDGLVRKVKIQIGTRKLDRKGRRDSKLSIVERPVQKLILLLETE